VGPPPPLPEATVFASIKFSVSDLQSFAKQANITIDPSVDLDTLALQLSNVLTNHALWEMSQSAGANLSDKSEWAAAVQRLAHEGLTLIGGGGDQAGWGVASSAAFQHLVRRVRLDDEGRRLTMGLLHSLSDALGRPIDETSIRAALQELLRRIPPALDVLHTLATSIADASIPPPTKRHDSELCAICSSDFIPPPASPSPQQQRKVSATRQANAMALRLIGATLSSRQRPNVLPLWRRRENHFYMKMA
jgi:hypothetical protein